MLLRYRRQPFQPLVALALGAVLASSASACRGRARRDDRPLVARVSGLPIYADELRRELKRVRLDGTADGADGTAQPAASIAVQKRALLDNLIDRRLILQEAEHANAIVGTDEVEAAYTRAHSGWDDGEFNVMLKDKDLTPAELKAELRDLLLIRKYFRDHVFSRVAVTDQEIEAYLASHPERLSMAEQVRSRYIVLRTEEEAQRVLKEITEGLAFEDAAIKYSQSPDGKNGGDLGWFARGVMPRTFDEVCFGLAAGQVSKVVPGEYGFYLFKVLEKRPAQTRSADAVRDEVEALLRRDKERAAQEAKVAELRQAATIEIQEDQIANIH